MVEEATHRYFGETWESWSGGRACWVVSREGATSGCAAERTEHGARAPSCT